MSHGIIGVLTPLIKRSLVAANSGYPASPLPLRVTLLRCPLGASDLHNSSPVSRTSARMAV